MRREDISALNLSGGKWMVREEVSILIPRKVMVGTGPSTFPSAREIRSNLKRDIMEDRVPVE